MKALISVAAICVVACGSSSKDKTREQLAKEYGPKLDARLDKLVAANRAGRAALDALGAPGDAQLALDFNFKAADRHPNAIAAHTEDLEDAKKPAASDDPGDRILSGGPKLVFAENDDNHVYLAKSVLGVEKLVSYYHEYPLKQILDAKYVLVVYPKSFTPPSTGLGGSDFKPGAAAATAVLVEIETGKALGGFDVTATNSEEVSVNVRKRDGASDAEDKIRDDLYAQIGKAIADGISKRWPGAKTPSNWGHGY